MEKMLIQLSQNPFTKCAFNIERHSSRLSIMKSNYFLIIPYVMAECPRRDEQNPQKAPSQACTYSFSGSPGYTLNSTSYYFLTDKKNGYPSLSRMSDRVSAIVFLACYADDG
jgi:hypothetical protein